MNGQDQEQMPSGGLGGGVSGGGGGGDIDFGEEQGPGAGMADMPPSGAQPGGAPMYPSVMLSGDQSLSKIPDEGRMLIHHKVTSRRIHTPKHGPHKGKERHEVEMEIRRGRPMRGYKKAAAKNKPSEDESAMKKLMGDQEEE